MSEHASPSNVRRFQPRATPTEVTQQLQASLQAHSLAPEIYAADQNLLLAPGDVAFDELRPEIAARYFDRAGIAVNLGEQIKRDTANEKAALAIVAGIEAGLQAGLIQKDSPLSRLDMRAARVVAKLGLAGGLNYLAGKDRT